MTALREISEKLDKIKMDLEIIRKQKRYRFWTLALAIIVMAVVGAMSGPKKPNKQENETAEEITPDTSPTSKADLDMVSTSNTSHETLKTKATLEAAREAYHKAYEAHHSAKQRLGEAVEEEEELLFEAELRKQALKGRERGREQESATAEEKRRRTAWWKRLVHGFRMLQGYAQLWMLEVFSTLFESKLARGFYHLVATIAMCDLVRSVVSGLYNIVTITRTWKPRDEDKHRD
ncbi:hypothetical protein N0V92_009650 [Colletotrichum tropicale]|nr:hypothetical protein N0V92_009650 [Colletotrichum tropicale]